MGAPLTQRQFLVSVSGIPGYFDSKTGGETSSETSKHYDGGSLTPDTMAAPAEKENITVTRGFKYERDRAVQIEARKKVGRWRTTLSSTPTNEDLVPLGNPTTYPDALLVRVSEPDSDSSSGDASTWEMEFAIGKVV